MSGIWNPLDNNGLSFSNGNLTVTNLTGSGVWYTCRATPFFEPSNRVYAEFTASNVGVFDSAVYLAVMTGNAALSLPGLTDANSVGYNQNGSTTYNGAGATLATWTTGNTICVAADGTAGKVWWRVNNGNWNNDGSALTDPTSNVGGISCPNVFAQGQVYFGVSIHTINYAITGNFNGTFTYTVPSGFSALPLVTASQGNAIFTSGSVGTLAVNTSSLALVGVSTTSTSVGILLPTTSAIPSVAAAGLTGTLSNILRFTMPSVQGSAVASFGTIATATSIYNYEGFDHENAQTDLGQGIITSFVNCTASISSASPYNSGSSLAVTVPGGSGYTIYNCGPNTLPCGVLGVMTQSNIYANEGTDIGFALGTSAQVFCRMSGGNILVYRGSPSAPTLITSLLNVIPAIGWFYLELNATIASGTGGSLTIFIDGVQIATLTSINTSGTGSLNFNGILLGGITPSGTSTTFMFDDVYVARSVLGPIRVTTLFPNANGSLVQFMTSGTISSNWQEVNELTLDFDTSYNFGSTYELIDEFMTTDLPTSTTSIVALKVTMAARKDADSTLYMGTLVSSNATIATGALTALNNTYTYYSDLYLVDPYTSASWTPSGINAAQIGYTTLPPSYIGPGDIVSGASAFYSLRGYSNAVAATGTQKAINVRRDFDDKTMDILILTNGNLDVNTLNDFGEGGRQSSDLYITTWYDQSGLGQHMTQATPASQPRVVSAPNGRVTTQWSAGQIISASLNASIPQPFTFVAVSARIGDQEYGIPGNFSSFGTIFGNGSFFPNFGFNNSASTAEFQSGNTIGTTAVRDGALHSMMGLASAAASTFTIDGATVSAGLTSSDIVQITNTNPLYMGSEFVGARQLTGWISEAAVWPIGLSKTQLAALHTNHASYWGTPP